MCAFCDCEVIHEEVVEEVRKSLAPQEEYAALAELFKLFGDPTRVKILAALTLREMCVCDLAVLLDLTKSAVSHQLKSLRLSNLVRFRKEGQVVYYSPADAHVASILNLGTEHVKE